MLCKEVMKTGMFCDGNRAVRRQSYNTSEETHNDGFAIHLFRFFPYFM